MSRILIVEDDLSIAELERDYLEISRFEVKICRDGTEGLKEALQGNYDMDRIASESYGTDYSGYWSAQSLINTGENGKVPDLNLYIAVIILYVLLSGPVLFFFLQSRGFGRIYRKGVLFLAVTFTFVIYLMDLFLRHCEQR